MIELQEVQMSEASDEALEATVGSNYTPTYHSNSCCC